jgi:uncharacterized membrane protein (DUF485 family)
MAKSAETYTCLWRESAVGFTHDGSMPAQISPDGRWWWDGTKWRSRSVEGPLDLFWFTTTPDWFQRVIVTGLIGLIPIVGGINTIGWALNATDMVRSGWKELPPAGFQHLERGVAPFVVSLVYGLVLSFVLIVLVAFAVLLGMSGRTQLVIAIAIGLVILVLLVAWWLAALYLFAALLIGSDKLGIGRALDPRLLYALARANHDASIRVALLYAGSTIAVGVMSSAVSVFFPFAIFLVALVLPAIYALLVPSLSVFRVEARTELKTT